MGKQTRTGRAPLRTTKGLGALVGKSNRPKWMGASWLLRWPSTEVGKFWGRDGADVEDASRVITTFEDAVNGANIDPDLLS